MRLWIVPAMLAVAGSALPGAGLAQPVMVPGQQYELRTPVTEPGRVVFQQDGRVIVWEGNAPEDTGRWYREGGQFCIEESEEFPPLCLNEVAGEAGAFSLTLDGKSMDFVPLPPG